MFLSVKYCMWCSGGDLAVEVDDIVPLVCVVVLLFAHVMVCLHLTYWCGPFNRNALAITYVERLIFCLHPCPCGSFPSLELGCDASLSE